MKKAISILILIVALFNFSSCDHTDPRCVDGHYLIQLINNSDKTIYWTRFNNDSVYVINGTPNYDSYIYPKSSLDYGFNEGRDDCLEVFFSDDYAQYLLYFDQDSVAAIGLYNISGTDRGLLKRFKVTLDYLEQHDYKLVYP